MCNNLSELIKSAQLKNQQSMTLLLKKFDPLIKKYSYRLNYEDAENDLILAFIEMIHKINLDGFQSENYYPILSYINRAIQNSFYNLSKKQYQISKMNLSYDDNIQILFKSDISNIETLDLLKNLTHLQKCVLKYKYLLGYSDREIGEHLSISRQAVNGIKNRAFNKLRQELNKR